MRLGYWTVYEVSGEGSGEGDFAGGDLVIREIARESSSYLSMFILRLCLA